MTTKEMYCFVCGETADVEAGPEGWDALPPGWLTRFVVDEDELLIVCSRECAAECDR